MMVQEFRILAALTQDSGSIPSTHMAVHNYNSQSQGSQCPLLASKGIRYVVYNIKKNFKVKKILIQRIYSKMGGK